MGIAIAPTTTEYPEYPDFAVHWTRSECRNLEEAGFLNYHYELVEGMIVKKMGQYKNHNASVIRAIAWLIGSFGIDFVQSQSTMDVAPEDNPTSAPEPDVVLLRVPQSSLPGDSPSPRDVRLIVEVSDTTLRYDLTTKAGLYARADIAEYWVISLTERRLYVHTRPLDGVYTVRTIHVESEMIAPLSAPDFAIAIQDLLPPPSAGVPESDTANALG